MPAMKGNRTVVAHVNGEERRYFWTTVQERNDVVRELRAAGLRPNKIAKLLGVFPGSIYRGTKPDTRHTYAKVNLHLREDTCDLIYRFAARHGIKVGRAVGLLVTKGAEAVNFKVDDPK
jgi:hypothetical protein